MSDTPKKFYLTTPIYYVNARPHIGHAYTTIVADVIARRHRLLGEDTFFLTGTDEHGQKIERSAIAAGIPPQQFADQVSKTFRDLWDRMGITYNDFIRTTDPRHKLGVQRLFKLLQDRGHIYLSTYTGQYCVSDEAYVDGPPGIRCPDCGRVTETVSESNYYFRLSNFQLPLLNLIEPGPDDIPPQLQIQPDSRRKEVLSFLRGNVGAVMAEVTDKTPGAIDADSIEEEAVSLGKLQRSDSLEPYLPGALKDLSISRTSFHWGVPVPGDEAHVIYVWLDALANYMTAIGYGSDDPEDIAKFERFWPANLHLVGKEIIRFHCIYWPAFLLALNPEYIAQPATQPGAPGLDSETWVPPEPQTTEPPPLSLEQHHAWAEKMLPKAITAHGWLLFEDSKMSKTRGNIVRTETILDAFGEHYRKELVRLGQPEPAKHEQDLFASDVLRYFLLREIPFGQDGSFSFDALITRYNADLANLYGNLVRRTLSMINANFQSTLPTGKLHLKKTSITVNMGPDSEKPTPWIVEVDAEQLAVDATLALLITEEAYRRTRFNAPTNDELSGTVVDLSKDSKISGVVDTIMGLCDLTNKFLSTEAPWKIEDPEAQGFILYTAAESIRIITALLYPILPYATAKVWHQLGLGDIEVAARNGDLKDLQWGRLKPGTKLGPLAPIFPRADKGLAQIMADMEQNTEQQKQDTPAPSKLTTETTSTTPPTPPDSTHPGAPPRTSAIEEHHPIAQVAGSASPTTQLHKPPSHTEAFASGPFNTAQSSQPIAPSSIRNPPIATPSQGQQSSTPGSSMTPSEGRASSPTTGNPASTTPTGGPASSATPKEGPAFSRAEISPAEGGTALPKTVLPDPAATAEGTTQITIDDFAKVELRVAKILVAERIPKADKLLRLEVDLGTERRQILSGIAEWYAPEDLIGRKIVVITNLAPRKMRGLESHGMLLAASSGENGKPALATFADSDIIEVGARLK